MNNKGAQKLRKIKVIVKFGQVIFILGWGNISVITKILNDAKITITTKRGSIVLEKTIMFKLLNKRSFTQLIQFFQQKN